MERCLPADAPDEELERRGSHAPRGAVRDQGARRRPRPAHPRPLHAQPLPAPRRRCSSASQQRGHRSSASRSTASATTGGSTAEDLETLETRRLQAAHRAAEPVRQPALRPRAHRGAVRLHATGWRSTRPRPSAAGATSCCRCSTATGSSRRIDLAMDRKRNVLQAHRGPQGAARAARQAACRQAIRRELERLAAWRGATGIEVLEAPPEWLGVLRRVALISSSLSSAPLDMVRGPLGLGPRARTEGV